jgi:tetratricopeptide (TPR) repeat protein
LAELARLVICRSPGTPESPGFLTLAIAHMADACRAVGDLPWAEELFADARSVVASQEVTDPRVVARIDRLEGTFRKVQDRWAEAEKLLSRAAVLYETSGDLVETSHALLGLGGVYFHQGSVDRAIETVQAALEILPADTEPLLYAYCRHNLIVYLAEAGRYEEAEELLERDEVYDLILKPRMQLRLLWARGKIALLTGKKAEPFLLEARDWFLDEDLGYEAAMVSLDLAYLYLKEGRMSDLQRLTKELVVLFQAQAFDRGAMTALLLFRDAVRREQGTVAMVEEVMGLLRVEQGRG